MGLMLFYISMNLPPHPRPLDHTRDPAQAAYDLALSISTEAGSLLGVEQMIPDGHIGVLVPVQPKRLARMGLVRRGRKK